VPQEPQAVVRLFASALDAEDYAAARGLLADRCVYFIGDATLIGPDAIINSYRINGEAAKERFDSIEYVSDIEMSGPSSAVISFSDHLRCGNERHVFHCRQHVRVGLGGLIEEIRHEKLREERQRLKRFESRLTRR
jgi:hypothetical protein